jgi:AraC-like DNA-binding protein
MCHACGTLWALPPAAHHPNVHARPPASAPISQRAATPIAFVHAILTAYARRGLSPNAALSQAQIPPSLAQSEGGHITAWQFEQLSGLAMRELDDEALGWFRRRLPWGSYGMLARASMGAPHLGLALSRWCRHHGLLTEDVTLTLEKIDGVARLGLQEHCDLGPLREFCHASLLRNALGLASWLVDSRLPLLAAEFAFAAPAHVAAYGVLFPAPATFGAPRTEVHFDARYLALPLRRDEAALQLMLQNALPLTVLSYRRDRLLVQRVRQLLLGVGAGGTPSAMLPMHSAESLAETLHLSPRTLHRQLRDEGATLQALKDDVRRQRATELLHRTDRPIKQVAQAAGFMNEKSFIRAFRGWTGLSPAEFRRQARTPD